MLRCFQISTNNEHPLLVSVPLNERPSHWSGPAGPASCSSLPWAAPRLPHCTALHFWGRRALYPLFLYNDCKQADIQSKVKGRSGVTSFLPSLGSSINKARFNWNWPPRTGSGMPRGPQRREAMGALRAHSAAHGGTRPRAVPGSR